MKKLLVALLIGILCLIPVAGGQTAYAADKDSLQNGDVVVIGSYPQTKVTDSTLIKNLDAASKYWHDYPYYSKNTNYTEAQTLPTKQNKSMMQYADFTYNGVKYRAVKINQYRPIDVLKVPDSEGKQSNNGYIKGTVYYFKYEPIRWVILDKSSGLLVSEKVLDAQPFNAYYQLANGKAMSTINDEASASNYYYSTVRHWLNADGNFDTEYGNCNFLNTAFSSTERSALKTNSYTIYDGGASTVALDYVFLLSKSDATTYKGNYTSTDNTDYAEAQGMSKRGGATGTPWYTSTFSDKTNVYYVQDRIIKSSSDSVLLSVITSTQTGIRPAIKVDISSSAVVGPLKLTTKLNSSTGNFSLSWNSISDASSYKVYRCPSSSNPEAAASWGSPIATLGAGVTAYTDTTAAGENAYFYRVMVTTSSGTETSNYIRVDYRLSKPVMTSSGRDAETGYTTITWKKTDGAESYEIQRSLSGSWTTLTTVDAGTSSTQTYKDTSAKAGNQYSYRIKAISSKGTSYDSVYSAEKTARCTLPRPTGVTKSDSDMGMPKLSWNAVSGANGYRVQYKKDTETEWKESITTLTFINLNDAEYGKTYSFRLSATYPGDSSNLYESAPATGSITCAPYPQFTKQPINYIAFSNQTQLFPTVQAAGREITYDWYLYRPTTGVYEYVNVYSGTSGMWSIIPTTEDDGALFYVIATDKFGRTARSNTGTISVLSQPTSTTVAVGTKAKFTTTTKYLKDRITSYQWQYRKDASCEWKDSGQSGNKTDTLTVATTAGLHGYQFRCIVTNNSGQTATSYFATLSLKPAITTQPSNQTVPVGNKATFTVEATGKSKLTYQWQYRKNSSDTWKNSGQSGNKTKTLSVATTAGLHGYQFRCVVTDGNSQKSYSKTVTLKVRPKITTWPKDTTVAPGSTAEFTVAATGKGPLKYQWQYRKNETSEWKASGQSGNKTATLKVAATAALNGYQFRCYVTDANGQKSYTNTVTLTVSPRITTQPVSKTVTAGATAKFTVTAAGKGTITYQWQYRKNSSSTWTNSGQSGNKTKTLSVASKASLNGYQFRCIVKDSAGRKSISNVVTLTVK